jgi:hypothetical protein
MICLEVVDLFLEHERPEIFAEELDHVEGVVEAGPVAREPASEGKQSAK